MKTKILIFFLLLTSLSVMGQGTIQRKISHTTKPVTPKHTPQPAPKKVEHKADGYYITFTCNVSPASFIIDGKDYGNASGPLFLKTGNHFVRVTSAEYEEYSRSIYVNGQNTSFDIYLIRKPIPTKTTPNIVNGHEWVDLGLSVKWATCNVGANSPSDYGCYYAWGESKTKNNYDFNNCFDCVNPDDRKCHKKSSWRTYKIGGQIRIMPTSGHDTARENWGAPWRMPTYEELSELKEKCKWLWTSMNGHNGYTVTGPNGNSIFLPASGYCSVTDSTNVDVGGFYWSSTHSFPSSYNSYYPYNSFGLDFFETFIEINFYFRAWGHSVRPVKD